MVYEKPLRATSVQVLDDTPTAFDTADTYDGSIALGQFDRKESIDAIFGDTELKIPFHAVMAVRTGVADVASVTKGDPYFCDDGMNCTTLSVTTAEYETYDGGASAYALYSPDEYTPALGDVLNITFNGETVSLELLYDLGYGYASTETEPSPSDYAVMVTVDNAEKSINFFHDFGLEIGEYPITVEVCKRDKPVMHCETVTDITTGDYSVFSSENLGSAYAQSSITASLGDIVNVTFNGETYSFEMICEHQDGAIASQCDAPTPSGYAVIIYPGDSFNLYHTFDLELGRYPMTVEVCSVGGGDDGGDDGDCETLFEETVTTSEQGGAPFAFATLAYNSPITADRIRVEFNGALYEIYRYELAWGAIYGGWDGSKPIFNDYPLAITVTTDGLNTIMTEDAGTYSIAVMVCGQSDDGGGAE